MSISRRQFFRGVVGQGERRQRDHSQNVETLDTYVRTNLLPYDFGLTADQTEEVLAAVRTAIDPDSDDVYTYDRQQQMNQIVEETVRPWREEFWKAEDVRRGADDLVQEFLTIEATPQDREQLCRRFHVPDPAVLPDEVRRQIRSWLAEISNSRIASCNTEALRELVFSEIRSWC
jgi:hypothetical protein